MANLDLHTLIRVREAFESGGMTHMGFRRWLDAQIKRAAPSNKPNFDEREA